MYQSVYSSILILFTSVHVLELFQVASFENAEKYFGVIDMLQLYIGSL